MPICRVKSAAVEERHNSKTNTINRSQTVGLDLGNGFELPFRVGLGSRPPYTPGEYDIDPPVLRTEPVRRSGAEALRGPRSAAGEGRSRSGEAVSHGRADPRVPR
ncbi:G5P family DNA-binding protein, partial [Bacillus cereus]|uniref:G5P family DNA-binding protein n=1 Tax=Bacillus cereus TaxID=1396 RepID=UPI001E561BEA